MHLRFGRLMGDWSPSVTSCILLCIFGQLASCGELITHTIQSDKLVENLVGLTTARDIKVLLPDTYDQSQKDYPVIYWFPGGDQGPTANIRTNEIAAEFNSGRASESIVVFVDSRTEFRTSLFLSSSAFGDWEGHLTEEIIPLVDTTYRTQSSSDKRGTKGFSLGGLTSLLLPIFVPDTFGAVGANDPSTPFTSGSVRTRDELPPGYEPPTKPTPLSEFFERFPDSIDGYGDPPVGTSAYGQLAVKLAPNPDVPLLGDIPFDEDGQWIPEAREAWRQFDLLNPNSVALHADAFRSLATVTVALPETAVNTNMAWNREMLRVFGDASIRGTGIEFAGDHNDLQHERFVSLLSDVSYALKGTTSEVSDAMNYSQDFDGLGSNGNRPADEPSPLPVGWSVSSHSAGVFRDQTNTPFNDGVPMSVGTGPFILNAGDQNDADRTLAVLLMDEADSATIQFLTDVSSLDVNTVQLEFDIEAWGKVAGDAPTDVDELAGAGFKVSAEFDFGAGFEELIDFGEFTLGEELSDPEGTSLNGNLDDNRSQFNAQGFAQVKDAVAMRLLFSTDTTVASPGWVYGIDNVELDFSFRGDLGDFDGDNVLTSLDIDLLTNAIRSDGPLEFDVNSDSRVDQADLDFWVTDLFGTQFGDANLDSVVDFADFLLFTRNFGTDTSEWAGGDFDGDARVAFSDFLLLSGNFSSRGNVAGVAVPEPTANLACLLGLLTVLQIRHRRHRY